MKLLFASLSLICFSVIAKIPDPLPTRVDQQGSSFMVTATNPYVTSVGYQVLADGGNAVDAMVAMQMVMAVVEPDMTGLGGGTFALYYERNNSKLTAFDARDQAPAAAHPEMFLDADGNPVARDDILGPRAVAIPGTLRLMYQVHQKKGSKPWAELLQPAIQLASKGYAMASYTHGIVTREQTRLLLDPAVRAMYWDADGQIFPAGTLMVNLELAESLKLVAEQGDKAMYDGELGQAIVDHLNGLIEEDLPRLTMDDFRGYQVKEREVIRSRYRGHQLASFGFPASGGMMVSQVLGMLETLEMPAMTDPEAWRLITEHSRVAKADRIAFAGDPDFAPIPTQTMLSEPYLETRAGLVPDKGAMADDPPAGDLVAVERAGEDHEGVDTSHISIVDTKGNAISMTSTVGTGMGSGIMVRGILLNANMANFSTNPNYNGAPNRNRIEAGKRPRSAITPLMMFGPKGQLRLVIGSPGSSQIPGYVLKTIIGMVDWGLTAQEAIDLPNIQHGVKIDRSRDFNPSGLLLEKNSFAEMMAPQFTDMGYEVNIIPMISGLNAIEVRPGSLHGASDRRRSSSSMGR